VSFWVALFGHLSGLTGMAFTAFHAGTWAAPSDATIGALSGVLAAGSVIVKVWHDKGIRAAAVAAHAAISSSDLQADARALANYGDRFQKVETIAADAKTLAVTLQDQIDKVVPEQDIPAIEAVVKDVIGRTPLGPIAFPPAAPAV
jgi:hypothetical protein